MNKVDFKFLLQFKRIHQQACALVLVFRKYIDNSDPFLIQNILFMENYKFSKIEIFGHECTFKLDFYTTSILGLNVDVRIYEKSISSRSVWKLDFELLHILSYFIYKNCNQNILANICTCEKISTSISLKIDKYLRKSEIDVVDGHALHSYLRKIKKI